MEKKVEFNHFFRRILYLRTDEWEGRQVCWVENKREIPEEMYQKLDRFPLKVSIWGMIDNNGGFKIQLLHETLNAQQYVEILEENLLEVESLLKQKKIFQHNQAKPHMANHTLDQLDENSIATLQWPSKSPDLNLIGVVWALLKDLVWKNQNKFLNEDQLNYYIEDQFYNNPDIQQSIQNSYATMHQLIQQVIENQGGYIKI